MASRSDLFGYAGGHVPMDAVLNAEARYGAHGYGALNSASLLAEEAYGEDEDDDDFGALNSASLLAEEAYGEDEDEDDAGDDFGDDVFGDEGDEIDEDLDELDAELDSELYGSWYGATEGALAAPAGAEGQVNSLAMALNVGAFLPAFLINAGAEPGYFEYFMEKAASAVGPNDAREIAVKLMNQRGFESWNQLSKGQQAQLVRNAVVEAAIPGLQTTWDDPFRKAFQANPGIMGASWASLKALPFSIWNLIAEDGPNGILAVLQELPGLGPAATQALSVLGVQAPDQVINGLAIRYYFAGLVYPSIYTWLADSVTNQGQAGIQAVAESTRPPVQAPRYEDVGPLPRLENRPEVIPSSGSGFPEPQNILAVGYGLVVLGGLTGIL